MRGGAVEMSARRYAILAGLAFFVLFVAGNLIANSWFRAARLDLTANHLYSISPGTREVLSPRELSEPITLTFFYSRDAAAASPDLQAYAARVREMLQSYQAASRGRIRLIEVNPKPFTDEEDEAAQAGLQPVTLREGDDPIYFGLSGANAIDDKRAISYFDVTREPFLEYEVTRLVYELEHPDPPKAALITSLPLDPAMAQVSAQFGQRPSAFASELGRFMHVEKLAPDFAAIPADATELIIIHPGPLTPAQTFAIDQFIMQRGRAFIALDPASMAAAQSGADPSNPFAPQGAAPTSSSLPALLTAWGLAMTPEVVLDGDAALPVQTQTPDGRQVQAPQPLFFRVDPDRLAKDDLITAPLTRGLNFGMAGALTWSERQGLTITPLARTTAATMRIPAEAALMRPSPFDLMQSWAPASRIETVALRLSGVLPSAFPNGSPEGVTLPEGAQALRQSRQAAEIVLVSDADFLEDDFYVDPQRGATFADNGSFAINAIDVLGGSQALVSLRARAPALRRMVLVDRLAADAQRRIESRQQELQADLQETEQRLQQLRARGQGSGYFSGELGAELSPEERTEVDRFTQRVTDVRRQLRGVARDLRGDIDRLKAVVVFVNMWLAPLLVAGAGLYLFWRRQRRARRPS